MASHSVERTIREACDNGIILAIVYDGGTQPGAQRDVVPIAFSPPYFLAQCLASGKPKYYRLDLIARIAEPGDVAPVYSLGAVTPPKQRNQSLIDVADELVPLLVSTWHVEASEDRISIHKVGKRCKPLKSPVASIAATIAIEESFQRYVVEGPNISARTYRYLDRAVETFRKECGLPLGLNSDARTPNVSPLKGQQTHLPAYPTIPPRRGLVKSFMDWVIRVSRRRGH